MYLCTPLSTIATQARSSCFHLAQEYITPQQQHRHTLPALFGTRVPILLHNSCKAHSSCFIWYMNILLHSSSTGTAPCFALAHGYITPQQQHRHTLSAFIWPRNILLHNGSIGKLFRLYLAQEYITPQWHINILYYSTICSSTDTLLLCFTLAHEYPILLHGSSTGTLFLLHFGTLLHNISTGTVSLLCFGTYIS